MNDIIDRPAHAASYDKGVPYKGFRIVPKRDWGRMWHLVDGMPCYAGFVCVKDGCNVMPGATWAQTVAQAKELIDVYLHVGGDGPRFWETLDKIKAAKESAAAVVFAQPGFPGTFLGVTDEFMAALRDVSKAMDFARQCKAQPELAAQTGAAKDAREWMVRAMTEVVAHCPKLPDEEG